MLLPDHRTRPGPLPATASRLHLHRPAHRTDRFEITVWQSIGFPHTSLGMRLGGEVVGWVINHATGPHTLRFTCAYIRKDLGRRGAPAPGLRVDQQIERTPFSQCTFVVPLKHATMVAFAKRWIEPWAGLVTETRGSSKRLVASESGATVRDPLVVGVPGPDPVENDEVETSHALQKNSMLRGEI